MKERPILFSEEMILAILAGSKHQTRRVIKKIPSKDLDIIPHFDGNSIEFMSAEDGKVHHCSCPYGQVGDFLWVREPWARVPRTCTWRGLPYQPSPNGEWNAYYRAGFDRSAPRWISPLFMPRWASRILLKICDIRIERVREISVGGALINSDVANEGCPFNLRGDAKCEIEWYSKLWDKIHTKEYSWSANPWVWVIDFTRVA